MANPPDTTQLTQAGFQRLTRLHGLEALRRSLADRAAALSEAHLADNRALGSLIPIWDAPELAELITHPGLLAALKPFGTPALSGGFVIAKPPRSPAMFWHQDYWAWDLDESYTAVCRQVGALVYLDAADRAGGCLRVIPGSHRRRQPQHRPLPDDERRALRAATVREPPALAEPEAAVDLEVSAGEVILVDARTLHATRPNTREQTRVAVTLWFLLDFDTWPDPLRRRHGDRSAPLTWPTLDLLPSGAGPGGAPRFTSPDERLA